MAKGGRAEPASPSSTLPPSEMLRLDRGPISGRSTAMLAAMGMELRNQRPWTLDEWAALDDDADGELVDGRIEQEELGSYIHETVVAFLIELFRAWGRAHAARVAPSSARFAVTASRGRKPDVSVYLRGAPRPPPRGLISVPPSIAVEVVSASPADQRRDRVDKLHEYAAFAVRWYWLIDPEARTLEILELGADGRYAVAAALSTGRLDPVPGCEGLVLDLDALWAELDEVIAEGGEPS